MFRPSIVLFSLLATACAATTSEPSADLDTGLADTRTLGSLDAAETHTLCETVVAYFESETARDDARLYACTTQALLGGADAASCEVQVEECLPDARYVSTIDCEADHFGDDCEMTVEQFERCATEQAAMLTGRGRPAIDCSLAGTEDPLGAPVDPSPDCIGFGADCTLAD